MSATGWVRWTAAHGVPRGFPMVRARRGDPLARLLLGRVGEAERSRLFEYFRRRGGLVRTPFAWASADHEICRMILRDSRFGVPGTDISRPAPTRWADPALSDPVEPVIAGREYARHRRLAAPGFPAIEDLRGRVEAIASGLLDELEADRSADLLADFAARLPITVAGIPDSPERVPSAESGPMAADCAPRCREIAVDDPPLIDVGSETTVNLIGDGIALLLKHPDELARLRADPELWPAAVEEILRSDSPVQLTVRIAHHDTEFDGIRVVAGERVVLLLGGANRDPAVFAEPARFDITRPNADAHLAFGSGTHACPAAAQARIEGTIALRALFERYPDLVLSAAPEREGRATGHGYRRRTADLGGGGHPSSA